MFNFNPDFIGIHGISFSGTSWEEERTSLTDLIFIKPDVRIRSGGFTFSSSSLINYLGYIHFWCDQSSNTNFSWWVSDSQHFLNYGQNSLMDDTINGTTQFNRNHSFYNWMALSN